MNRVYLDNAATTAVAPEVLQAMLPYFTECYGNPSSLHSTGRDAHRAVDRARRQAAAAIGCEPREIYFTAGGSESDNWAIKGTAFAQQSQGNHIITTQIEHHAVLHTCAWLEKHGFEVTYLPVNSEGFVDPAAVEAAITDRTILISVMLANNEIGTIEPVKEIAAIARRHGITMHTDAVQAMGAIPVNVDDLGVDLLSMSGHKFHGPKGIGALYVRSGTLLDVLIAGGAQERGLRAGTENLPGIVGIGKALELASANLERYGQTVSALRDRLLDGLAERIPGLRINGPDRKVDGVRASRLPNNADITIPGVDGETLLMRLDLQGVAASSGSACTSGSPEPSHVLETIGLPPELTRSSLRLTLGSETTQADIDFVLEVLPGIVKELRA